MKIAKLIYKFIQGALAVAVFSIVVMLLLGHFGYVNTVKPFVVQSGSMEPTVPTASIIFSLPQDSYNQGDIVTFHPEGNTKKTVTHRVEFKLYPDGVNGEPLFLTAGDANEDVDNWEVRSGDIIGKEVITIPYAGYLVDFAKKPQGFILLVIVPATIVIYEELKSLFIEVRKSFSKFLERRKDTFKGGTFKDSKTSPPKALAIIPVVGAGIFLIAFSASYFTDIEESIGNIFRVGTWGPPPSQIAETLVINEVLPVSTCPIGGSNKTGVWLEVYNGYSTEVNLKNYKIADGNGDIIDLVTSNTLVPAGSFALIAHDNATWIHCFSDNSVITANFGGGKFDINTGTLKLIDPGGVVIDKVVWGEAPLNPSPDQSIEREPDGQDTALVDDFSISDFKLRPTPQPGL